MRKAAWFALTALVAVGWLSAASPVWAAPAHGTISISNQSVGTGSIKCSGPYTVDSNNGWSVSSITLYAYPQAGGAQSSQGATFGGGNWGPTTISGLTSGVKYTVYAQMIIMNGANSQTINSATTTLTPN